MTKMADSSEDLVEALELLPRDWKIEILSVHGGWYVRVSAPTSIADLHGIVKFEGTLSSLDMLDSILRRVY